MWVWLQIWSSSSGRDQPFSAPMVLETSGHLGRHHRVLHPKEALAALPLGSSTLPPTCLAPPCRLNQEEGHHHPCIQLFLVCGGCRRCPHSSCYGTPCWIQPHQCCPVDGGSPGLSHRVRSPYSQQDLYKQHHAVSHILVGLTTATKDPPATVQWGAGAHSMNFHTQQP